jgi:uncharacterized protein YjiS (DUF1127 family)
MSMTMLRGSVPAISPATGNGLRNAIVRGLRYLEAALTVAAERRRLGALDERQLQDMGLSRSIAAREAGRDFFDVPAHRIRHK